MHFCPLLAVEAAASRLYNDNAAARERGRKMHDTL